MFRLRYVFLIALVLLGAVVVWQARRPSVVAQVEPTTLPPRTPAQPAKAPPRRAPQVAESAPLPAAADENAVATKSSIPPALAAALAKTDPEERLRDIEAALRAWAAEDLEAADAWVRAQAVIPRANAMAAVINGAASGNADNAVNYVKRLSAEDQENAAEYGNFLIIGLSEAGEYQRAAAWSASTDEANIDWLTQAYDRWALAKPEAALLHAVALTDPTKRRAASDAAIGAWAKTEPKALAECAVNFPPGQEKNLAIVTGLRAWAATEPEKVSEWMIAHRDAIASVPNLATINED